MSDYPETYRYTRNHEWIAAEGDTARVGITDYAQGELGDIIFVELPAVGAQLKQDEPFASIEAVKSVEEVFAPADGEVIAVNEDLDGAPETVNQSPFSDGWLVEIRLADAGQLDGLMDRDAYLAMVGE
ncbi:MAG: glycine cleavage system protein GcvH [Candidatus Krumholzibacteriota bacterium]|nr:glycine cleavage system protein GcvH [Candidatus Krumholzibacteriota bacterium]